MDPTKLSKEDRELLYTARWTAGKAIEIGKGQSCPPSVTDYLADITDLLTEVLDVESPSHVDGDLRPNVKNPKPTIDEETLDGSLSPVVAAPVGRLYCAIGHNDGTGSTSFDGKDEWRTSRLVAERMKVLAPRYGLALMIGLRDRSKGYGDAMRLHGNRADVFKSDLNVEIHRNAFNGIVAGVEFIVASDAGAAAGRVFAAMSKKLYPDASLRGDDGIQDRREGGRGAGFCRAGKAPSIVLEGCFHDNKEDWPRLRDDIDREARMYLAAARASIMIGTERVPTLTAAGEFIDQVFPQGALQA
jgi:hypothetical protein